MEGVVDLEGAASAPDDSEGRAPAVARRVGMAPDAEVGMVPDAEAAAWDGIVVALAAWEGIEKGGVWR